MPIFSSVRKKNEEKFWDMEIIGNRRKIYYVPKKESAIIAPMTGVK